MKPRPSRGVQVPAELCPAYPAKSRWFQEVELIGPYQMYVRKEISEVDPVVPPPIDEGLGILVPEGRLRHQGDVLLLNDVGTCPPRNVRCSCRTPPSGGWLWLRI